MPIYLGREEITMKNPDAFYSLPYVNKALNGEQGPNPFVINCCHGDHVAQLPRDLTSDKDFVLHGSSERTPHELWTYGTRILSMQAHPELSHYLITKYIIERMTALGRFNEKQR